MCKVIVSSPEPSEIAPPDAAAMAEALRGVGYSLATSIADIIDNSIAAYARNVWIDFHWNCSDSWIRIADDGTGMTAAELFHAMRLGARNPLEKRADNDLGRFGLGLKTASFSQCRRLTVASRKGLSSAARRWDLDHIAVTRDWHLLSGAAPGSEERLNAARERDGTIVLWESLDRVPGVPGPPTKQSEDIFLEAIDHVEHHLAMVFHCFLEGTQPDLRIFINGTDDRFRVRPWDPFLSGNPATTHRPMERVQTNSGVVEVKGYVLPHKDRLSKKEYESGGGPEGWTAQQGFYVYRNRRLLVAGSWLGLGAGRAWTKEEAHKLARLRVDIRNTADTDWKIDIKKSSARPPVELKSKLRALAEDARDLARKVFAHRGNYGPSQADPALVRAWRSTETGGAVKYRIDRQHPAVREVLTQAGDAAASVEAMLRVIEETVPVQKIWLDTVEKGEVQQAAFAGEPPAEVLGVLTVLYTNMRRRVGLEAAQAKAQLLRTEPFSRFPKLIEALPDEP